MITKNDIKYIQSLQAAGERAYSRQFIAEGTHMAEEAFGSALEKIVECYATETWLAKYEHLVRMPATVISEQEMTRISTLKTPQGVLLIMDFPEPLSQPLPTGKWLLALDGIQDPGNAGTMLRIADWFGMAGVLAENGGADWFGPKVVQASMGSIFRIPVCTGHLPELLKSYAAPVYGAVLDGESIWTHEPTEPGCLVVGSEGRGLSPAMTQCITKPITIPRLGQAESLNAAMAAGILASHLCKPTESEAHR